MSVTMPVIGLATIVALALIARRNSYEMTSTSLMMLAAALAAGYATILYISG
jgi:hypothetical protein